MMLLLCDVEFAVPLTSESMAVALVKGVALRYVANKTVPPITTGTQSCWNIQRYADMMYDVYSIVHFYFCIYQFSQNYPRP